VLRVVVSKPLLLSKYHLHTAIQGNLDYVGEKLADSAGPEF